MREIRSGYGILGFLLPLFLLFAPAPPSPAGEAELSLALERLETALGSGRAGEMRDLLPEGSKVYLQLRVIREAEGYFGAGQVIKVFAAFFERHPARGFERLGEPRVETGKTAHLRGRLRFGDEGKEPASLILALVLTRGPEGWTLREVREGS